MRSPTRLVRACLVAIPVIALCACGALHEEIPAGVEYEPGSVDVLAPGSEDARAPEDARARRDARASGSNSRAAPARTAISSAAALTTTADTSGLAADQMTLDALDNLEPSEAAAGVAPRAAARGAEAAVSDVTGDGIADLILAEGDGRLLVAAHGDGGWTVHELPVLPAGVAGAAIGRHAETGTGSRPSPWRLGERLDVDGDGVAEVSAWRQTSADATDVALLRWDGSGFRDLLALQTTAQSTDPWESAVTRSTDAPNITIACSPVAPLGSFGVPASVVTRTYSWNDRDAALELTDVQTSSPEEPDAAVASARAALNDAESALRAGDLDTAEALFQEAAAARVEGPEPGLAMLRLGLTYALSGRAAQARIAVGNALDAPNGLAEVADAFLRGYDTSNAALGLVTARAAAPALAPPLNASAVLWSGHEIAAWIAANSVADIATGADDTLGADLDATVVGTAVADLDGDGTDEAAVLLSREPTGRATLWLVDPAPARDSAAGALVLPIADGVESVALGQLNAEPALEVSYLGRGLVLTWDGAHALLRHAGDPELTLGYAAGTDPRPGHEPCTD